MIIIVRHSVNGDWGYIYIYFSINTLYIYIYKLVKYQGNFKKDTLEKIRSIQGFAQYNIKEVMVICEIKKSCG